MQRNQPANTEASFASVSWGSTQDMEILFANFLEVLDEDPYINSPIQLLAPTTKSTIQEMLSMTERVGVACIPLQHENRWCLLTVLQGNQLSLWDPVRELASATQTLLLALQADFPEAKIILEDSSKIIQSSEKSSWIFVMQKIVEVYNQAHPEQPRLLSLATCEKNEEKLLEVYLETVEAERSNSVSMTMESSSLVSAASSSSSAKNEMIINSHANQSSSDLYEYPEGLIKSPGNINQLTVGDMHANAIKFIEFLIREGVVELENNKQDYEKLVKLYFKRISDLTPADLSVWDRILSFAKWHKTATIRLIGDELCDRGKLDLYILKILRHLLKEAIPVEIVLSNHLVNFLLFHEAVDSQKKRGYFLSILPTQCQSLSSLVFLTGVSPHFSAIQKFEIQMEVQYILKKIYKNNLKLLSYTIDPELNSIRLFSHAPIGFATVKCIALELGLVQDYRDHSIYELADTIDKINRRFHDERERVIEEADFSKLQRFYNKFERLTWYDYEPRQGVRQQGPIDEQINISPHGYVIEYGHGHTGGSVRINHPHVASLDTMRGKANLSEGVADTEPYVVLRSVGLGALQLAQRRQAQPSQSSFGLFKHDAVPSQGVASSSPKPGLGI